MTTGSNVDCNANRTRPNRCARRIIIIIGMAWSRRCGHGAPALVPSLAVWIRFVGLQILIHSLTITKQSSAAARPDKCFAGFRGHTNDAPRTTTLRPSRFSPDHAVTVNRLHDAGGLSPGLANHGFETMRAPSISHFFRRKSCCRVSRQTADIQVLWLLEKKLLLDWCVAHPRKKICREAARWTQYEIPEIAHRYLWSGDQLQPERRSANDPEDPTLAACAAMPRKRGPPGVLPACHEQPQRLERTLRSRLTSAHPIRSLQFRM